MRTLFTMLGVIGEDPEGGHPVIAFFTALTSRMDLLLGWVLALMAVAGSLFAIYLGVKLATAEDEGKRTQVKAQFIWSIIAVVIVGSLIVILLALDWIALTGWEGGGGD